MHESTDMTNWSKLSDAPWTARGNHSGIVFNNMIIIMGGYDSGGRQHDVWSYNGSEWNLLGDAQWSER